MGISDEIIADGIDIVAVIDIGQIIYFGNKGPAECIYYGRPFVFGLSLVDQAAGKNRSFAFCSSRPDMISLVCRVFKLCHDPAYCLLTDHGTVKAWTEVFRISFYDNFRAFYGGIAAVIDCHFTHMAG